MVLQGLLIRFLDLLRAPMGKKKKKKGENIETHSPYACQL